MKPDKIYTDGRSVFAELPIFSQTNANIEYIRKDTLLEWLEYEKEWFEGTDIEPHYQKMIDKLNSM